MLFNTKKNQINGTAFCLECEYFINKKCEGLGKICYEYDPYTMKVLDPITHLPKKEKGEGNGH